MTPHSSTLAWKIPWTEEPGRLQSMKSLRVGEDIGIVLEVLPVLALIVPYIAFLKPLQLLPPLLNPFYHLHLFHFRLETLDFLSCSVSSSAYFSDFVLLICYTSIMHCLSALT